MKKTGFIFEVGDLIKEQQGTRITFELDDENNLKIEGDYKSKSNIKGEVTFMKLDEGIHVHLKNVTLKLEFECTKCMSDYVQKIEFPSAERVFYLRKQRGNIDENDIYYVNMKTNCIDISEFLRQEIILHFPMIPVCSKSCKGLCPKCGKNLNKGKCNCKKEDEEEKPLASLKKIYKDTSKKS